jgi:hypothetical protein
MIIVDTGFWLALGSRSDKYNLGHGRIFSSGLRDFNVYRWNNSNPFENLFLKNRI